MNVQYGLFSGIEGLVNQALAAFPTVERVCTSSFYLTSGRSRRTCSIRRIWNVGDMGPNRDIQAVFPEHALVDMKGLLLDDDSDIYVSDVLR